MQKLSFIFVLVLMIIIAYYSIVPAPIITEINYFDKIEHSIAYFVLSFAVFYTIKNKAISFIYVFVYSIFLEIVQLWVPNRFFSYVDIGFNFIGCLFMIFVAPIFIKKKI